MLIIKPATKIKNNIRETRQLAEATPLRPKIPASTARTKNVIARIIKIILDL